jgi:hypothetical protein
MVIDFTEIPQANKGGGQQDLFEQFTCDFLEIIGFKIIRRPDRGADGKKDLIVSETRVGVEGETTINWLVSCKHYAHSGTSIKDADEPDIIDRVNAHGCNGFMGVYSTIPASSLSNKLNGYKNKIESTIYDFTRIEKCILSNNQKERLLVSYFPKSLDKYRQQISQDNHNAEKKQATDYKITEEDVLQITKTAIIILEIEKIKEEYFNSDWGQRDNPLNKLYRFSEHSNEKVAEAVFEFLNSVAGQTRASMPSAIASSINSLILTFFPSSSDKDEQGRIKNGKICIEIGFGLVYDAFIYLNNFRIAGYGLAILKFIYREGNRMGLSDLTHEVLQQYDELERTLNRPERSDLEPAKELVKIFKDDLNTKDLRFPVLPDHLYKLIEKES